jgi:hypothetical protein
MTTATRRQRLAIACAGLVLAPAAGALGFLENPAHGAAASGIGVISGWHCTARVIELQIDSEPPLRAGMGTTRPDTAQACGHPDSGFGLTFNWARLAPGSHTIRALADGVEFDRSTFTVASYGAEFLNGKAGAAVVPDFPAAGRTSMLEWSEASQSFVMRSVADSPYIGGRWNGADLETRRGCNAPQNDGNHGTYAQFDINASDTGFLIQQSGITGLNCTYTGTFTPGAAPRTGAGSYSCTDGKRGDFTASDFRATQNEFSIKLAITLTGSERCSIDAILGGLRY